MGNTFGNLFSLTTFGESHGAAIGGVVDGMPAGTPIRLAFIQSELNRRRPAQSLLVSQRQEADQVTLLSGVMDGVATGAPIAFVVGNTDARPADYEALRDVYRPSHADFTYQQKYGLRDYRGGGRASARTTIARVVGGALAKMALRPYGIAITAYVSQIGSVALERRPDDLSYIEESAVRCPDKEKAEQMEALLRQVRSEGDTVGGAVTCVVSGCPVGVGNPEFDKLNARLALAMLSIPAAKGFEIGDGFALAAMRGSQANDPFACHNGRIVTTSNHSGGIQGGISNGQDIVMRVAFKPVPTLAQPQTTVDIHGNPVEIRPTGRHDICVAPRAVVVVEAMAALTLLDLIMNK